LFLLRGDRLLRADLGGSGFSAPRAVATIPGIRDYDTAHRSGRLLVLRSANGPPPAATVVVHWRTPLAAAQAPPPRR
jgi:hypothetical protein